MSNINLIFIIFLLFLFLIFFFKDNNPYKLIMIFGKKGSGKTSYIAKMSMYYLRKGYTVYTNCHIKGTHQYDPKLIGQYTFPPNSIVFCDEVGIVWNNREYKNFQKCVLEWFKYQRQYKITMYLFSQVFDDNDKAIRSVTDKLYLIKRCGRFSFLRPIVKNVGIGQDQNGNGQIVDSYKFGSIFDIKLIWLSRYYGLFKSFNPPNLDIIQSTFEDYDDLSLIYRDTKKWFIYRFKCFIFSLKGFIYEKFKKIS